MLCAKYPFCGSIPNLYVIIPPFIVPKNNIKSEIIEGNPVFHLSGCQLKAPFTRENIDPMHRYVDNKGIIDFGGFLLPETMSQLFAPYEPRAWLKLLMHKKVKIII